MPIYDYRCADCGKVIEVILRKPDSVLPACPSCQGDRLERQPSAGHATRFHYSAVRAACGVGESCDGPGAGCSCNCPG